MKNRVLRPDAFIHRGRNPAAMAVVKGTVLWVWFLIVAAVSRGQGYFEYQNVGVNGGARAPVYAPDPANPYLQRWGNTSNAYPAGSQTYGGALLFGSNYSVEAWSSTNAPVNPLALSSGATVVPGSTTAFIRLPGFFIGTNAEVWVPNSIYTPTSSTPFGVYLQIRVWDNANGQLPAWGDAWTAAQAGSGRALGWSEVFWQPLEIRLVPYPGMFNFESFNIFVVPEPSSIAFLFSGGALLGLFRWRRRRPPRIHSGLTACTAITRLGKYSATAQLISVAKALPRTS